MALTIGGKHAAERRTKITTAEMGRRQALRQADTSNRIEEQLSNSETQKVRRGSRLVRGFDRVANLFHRIAQE